MKLARVMGLTVLVALAAVALMAASAQGTSLTWDRGAGTNNWSTAANWSPDQVPTSADDATINGNSTAENPVTISSAAAAANLYLGGTGYNSYLAIQNNLTVTGTLRTAYKGTGTITHSAGNLTCATFQLISSTTTGGTGTYTLSSTGTITSSGTFSAGGGTGSVFTQSGASTSVQAASIATGNTGSGDRHTYNLVSGTLTVDGSVSRSYGAWLFEQTGGTASIGGELSLGNNYRTDSTGGPMEWIISGNSSLSIGTNVTLGWIGDGGTHLGTNSQGRLVLNGSKGTGSNVTVGGYWRQTGSGTPNTSGSLGTLKGVIDQSAVGTPANMRKVAVTGNVTFDDGSILDVAFAGGVTPTAGTWTLMTWSGSLTDNGLEFADTVDDDLGDGEGWSFSTAGSALTVTYTKPSPPTARTWDANGGTGGSWFTAVNWNPDGVPGSGDDTTINGNCSSGSPVTISGAAATAANLYLGGTGYNSYLAVQNNLTVTGSGTLRVAHKGTGTITHSAGTVTAGSLALCASTTTGGTGTYTLSNTGAISSSGALTASGGTGNTFTQSGASTSVQAASITTGNTGSGNRHTYQIASGSLTVTGSVSRTYGAWLFEQTGGTVSIGGELSLGNNYRTDSTGGPMEWIISGNSSLSIGTNVTLGWIGDGGSHLGTNSQGRLVLNGSRGTGSNVTVGGYWRQTGSGTPNTSGSLGTLKGVIDQSAVGTPANMRKVAVTGNVTFDDGSILDVAFADGVTPTAGTWTLMTWSGALTDNGLEFAATVDDDLGDGEGWSFSTANSMLTVTYVKSAVPTAPSNLSASAVSSSQINLSWTDNSNNETGFKIERKLGVNGTYARIATVGAGVTSYQNTGLTALTTYYYRVRAYNASGNSAYSNEANAKTAAAAPSVAAVGSVAAGTGTITPAIPSGKQMNDILLLFVETANQAVTISNQNGGTWAEVPNSPQGTGTAGDAAATRLTVFWSRYNGAQGNPTVSDSGDHQIGRIIAIRGVTASGNPWDVTAGGVEATADTSGSIPGATTTVNNTFVVAAIATALPDADSTAVFSSWANGNLTSVTERIDNSSSQGNGGGLGIATGGKATAGAYGNTTVTVSTATAKGMISIALKGITAATPAPPSTAPILTSQGFQVHITGPDEDWDEIDACGAKFIRKGLHWSAVEQSPGVYNFSTHDAILADMEERGLGVLFCLAFGNSLYGPPQTTQEGREAYAAYAAAAAEHYAGHNVIFEIWNEPNTQTFWGGSNGNSREYAQQYMALVNETVPAMRAEDPNCYILGGSVSCLWSASFVWLDECFKQGLHTSGINALSVHPYGFSRPELCIDPSQPGAVTTDGYAVMRAIMASHGAPDFPVVNSECGYATGANVTLDQQAMLFVRMFLVDQLCNIGFTTWYCWDEIDAAAFVFRSDGDPLPNYIATGIMHDELDGYHFAEAIKVGPDCDYQIAFENDAEERKVVAWTVPAARGDPQDQAVPHDVVISTTGWSGGNDIVVHDIYGDDADFEIGSGTVTVEVTASPLYIYLGTKE